MGSNKSPQGRLLDSSPSPNGMRDESREPILRKSTPEDIPKYKGTTKREKFTCSKILHAKVKQKLKQKFTFIMTLNGTGFIYVPKNMYIE